MELVNHACEVPRIQDLLGNIAQTVVHIGTHGALYIFLRHLLRIHDDQSIRPVHGPKRKDCPHAGDAQPCGDYHYDDPLLPERSDQ